jgi:hypothetical protein
MFEASSFSEVNTSMLSKVSAETLQTEHSAVGEVL